MNPQLTQSSAQRRTQEERSRTTREKIQQAAMRSLKRAGYSGATMARIFAPYAAALDRQWLDLFADTSTTEETRRTARQLARTCILGLLSSSSSGLGPIDQKTVDELKESVFHLLSSKPHQAP